MNQPFCNCKEGSQRARLGAKLWSWLYLCGRQLFPDSPPIDPGLQPLAAERLWVGCCLLALARASAPRTAPRSAQRATRRARATVWASFRFNQRRIYRGKSGRTLIHISSSTSRCAPDRTGPQIFPLRPVTSVLCMKSAITKGEEAMAVRGQKMLNDPFLLKRKSVTSVGGGGAKLFSSMLLTAFCSHQLRLSTHFKFRVSSQGLWLSCPTHRYRQTDVSLPTPNPDSHTLHNPGVGRHGFHYINQYSHFL